jgi:3-hydroxybutyryl-CoA dehydratase
MRSDVGAPAARFKVGDSAAISRTISDRDVELFAEVSGDYNPVHLDDDFAKTTRFGARIAHGMLTASLLSTVIGTKLPGEGAIYVSQTLFFVAPVYLGDTVTATATITHYEPDRRRMTLATVVRNQRGDEVVRGDAVIRYPT